MEQAKGPSLNEPETNTPDVSAVDVAIRTSVYAKLFETVYGSYLLVDDSDSQLNEATVFNQFGDAIAAYERSAEIQKFSSQYDACTLNAGEQRGFVLCKNHCGTFHTRQHKITRTNMAVDVFTSYNYANIGTPDNKHVPFIIQIQDLGRRSTIRTRIENSRFNPFAWLLQLHRIHTTATSRAYQVSLISKTKDQVKFFLRFKILSPHS